MHGVLNTCSYKTLTMIHMTTQRRPKVTREERLRISCCYIERTNHSLQALRHQLLFSCLSFPLRSSSGRLCRLLVPLLQTIQAGLQEVSIRLQGATSHTVNHNFTPAFFLVHVCGSVALIVYSPPNLHLPNQPKQHKK